MRKGLLKNVQDGISRPLGSREITKSKGEGFFYSPFNIVAEKNKSSEEDSAVYTMAVR